MRNLKNLVQDLDEVLDQHRSQLNTDVYSSMKVRVDQLKQEVDLAGAAQRRQLVSEALKLLAQLLSVVTNVMTLLK